jgi:hypothetical protein
MKYSEFLVKTGVENKDLEAVKQNGYALKFVKKDIFEAE